VIAFERIRDALESGGLATIDTGYGRLRAQCPGHTSATPNSRPLAVADKEGRALLICHAGCEYTTVLDALGLTARDLFDETTRAEPRGHRGFPRDASAGSPAPDVTSRDHLRTLADRFGSLEEAGKARAETHHDAFCAHCRTADNLGGSKWWGQFCANCIAGWASVADVADVAELQRTNALKQAAVDISQSCDWKKVAQRVRTGQ
jgi:hypothetical protein